MNIYWRFYFKENNYRIRNEFLVFYVYNIIILAMNTTRKNEDNYLYAKKKFHFDVVIHIIIFYLLYSYFRILPCNCMTEQQVIIICEKCFVYTI